MGPRHFPALDAVRSIACLMVLSGHLVSERLAPAAWLHGQETPPWWFGSAMFFFGNGVLGVRVFFVLSGFLITYLMLEEYAKTGRFSVKAFFIRRSLRILPLYYTVVAFIYGLYPWLLQVLGFPRPIDERFWMQVFFLSNFEQIRVLSTPGLTQNPMVALLWSVSVEEQFYLFWAFAVFAAGAGRVSWLALAALLASFAAQIYGHKDLVYLASHTLPNFFFLAGGALTACVFQRHQAACRTFFGRLGYPVCVVVSLALLGLALLFGLTSLDYPWAHPLYALATTLCCCWVFVTQIWRADAHWGLARIRPLVALAKYTYALYLTHRIAEWLVTCSLYALGWSRQVAAVNVFSIVLALVLSLVLSVLSYHLLESYFLRWQKKARRI